MWLQTQLINTLHRTHDEVLSYFQQRFGNAMTPTGTLILHRPEFADDFQPIEKGCPCSTCKNYTRAYLHGIVENEPVSCSLLTIHNVSYQVCHDRCQISRDQISSKIPLSYKTILASFKVEFFHLLFQIHHKRLTITPSLFLWRKRGALNIAVWSKLFFFEWLYLKEASCLNNRLKQQGSDKCIIY